MSVLASMKPRLYDVLANDASVFSSMNARFYDMLAICAGVGLLLVFMFRHFVYRPRTTKLAGPARPNWLFGVNRLLTQGVCGDIFEGWQKQYGNVFEIPTAMGGKKIALMDPRAVAYVWNGHSYNFRRHEGARMILDQMFGRGILSTEGADHKRHRKAMSAGFTPAAIRSFTTIFFDAAHKVAEEWTSLTTESTTGDALVNIETWLNSISLDSIGLAGFSHNFKCIEGERPTVMSIFTSFGTTRDLFSMLVMALFEVFPFIVNIPLGRNKLSSQMKSASVDIATKLLNERKVEEKDQAADRRSIISALIKAEDRTLSKVEVLAELNTLILAGFETTSTSMAWCLHELSMNPEVQDKLRQELAKFPDPNHDQLANDMPYLDAVVTETLRTHPVVTENDRVATSDDTIPLLHPVSTPDGKMVDSLPVKAGTAVIIPIGGVNRSTLIWGLDAHVFNPDRWLTNDLPAMAQELQGYRHILTFIDGPRHCIGKNFAVAEFKAVLSVLARNFVFKPKVDGKDVLRNLAITLRGRNEGMDGLYLRISKVGSE